MLFTRFFFRFPPDRRSRVLCADVGRKVSGMSVCAFGCCLFRPDRLGPRSVQEVHERPALRVDDVERPAVGADVDIAVQEPSHAVGESFRVWQSGVALAA